MKQILALVSIPALVVAALSLDGYGRAPVRTDSTTAASPARPDPLPVFSEMVFVPAGEFIMGSSTADLYHAAEVDEWPQRHVWVDDYYIDVHEVTNAQYKVFIDSMHVEPPPRWVDGNYGIGEDGLPVASVTWYDAVAYAKFVGKRLPTEAEWEKAARGTDGRRYPWGDDFDPHRCNNGDRPLPIQSFPGETSPYGCYDMAGNVAEWVADWYAPTPAGKMTFSRATSAIATVASAIKSGCTAVDRGTRSASFCVAPTAKPPHRASAGCTWDSAA